LSGKSKGDQLLAIDLLYPSKIELTAIAWYVIKIVSRIWMESLKGNFPNSLYFAQGERSSFSSGVITGV